MTSATVTVDLDYWQYVSSHRDCHRFFDFLREKYSHPEKRTYLGPLVVYHHHLLQQVNLNPADVLINIDAHDDLSLRSTPKESNWVRYVRWPRSPEYRWCHQQFDNEPRYHFCNKPWVTDWENNWATGTKGDKGSTRWLKMSHEIGWKWAFKDIDKINFVGICLSPQYVEPVNIARDLAVFVINKEVSISLAKQIDTAMQVIGRGVVRDSLVGYAGTRRIVRGSYWCRLL